MLGFKKIKARARSMFSVPFSPLSPDKIYYRQTQRMLKNIDLDSASLPLLKIARNISISSPSIYGYLQLMEGEIYGEKGFILDLDTPNEKLNTKIEGLYNEWGNNCDIKGEYDFRDFERFVLLHYLRDGECFVHIQNTDDGLKLQIIPPENIDYNYNDTNIKKGVEFDENHQVIAYYALNDEKDKRKRERIPKKDLIHIKKVFSSSSVRGISHLAPVIFKVMQSDKYLESVLTQAQIASKLSLIASPKDESEGYVGSMGDLGEDKPLEPKNIEIEDGRIIAMNENYKIEPLNIAHNPNIGAFMINIDRAIAKSLGISYASYTGDLSSVNFSSSRMGIVQERRLFKRIQKLIIRKFHTPIYKRFIEHITLEGKISASEYLSAVKDFSFKTQGWEYVDPQKEIQAQELQIKLGLKTIKEALADKGIELKAQARDIKEGNDILEEELKRIKNIFSPHPDMNMKNNNEE